MTRSFTPGAASGTGEKVRADTLRSVERSASGISQSGVSVYCYRAPDRTFASAARLAVLLHGESSWIRYGSHDVEDWRLGQPIPLWCEDGARFYAQALLPLAYRAGSLAAAVAVWVQVDPGAAAALLREHLQQGGSYTGPILFHGVCRSLVELQSRGLGLHADCILKRHPGSALPVVHAIDERASAFPGLAALLEESATRPPDGAIGGAAQPAFGHYAALEDAEEALIEGRLEHAAAIWDEHQGRWELDAHAQLIGGRIAELLGDDHEAIRRYHRAQQLDHPAARELELAAHRRVANPLHQALPQAFLDIKRGDRLRALTALRSALPEHPLSGNAVLSYCLRGAGCAEEGLRAARASLALCPFQSDVLGNEWSFLLELEQVEDLLECALQHVRRYPQDPAAVSNLVDSLLLNGRNDEALFAAHRYLIVGPSLSLALRQLFKPYEALGRWRELLALYEQLFPLLSGPTPETLCCFGEALIENERFEDAFAIFERAIAAQPGSALALLGYARALARSDREDAARHLLETALADPNRIDSSRERGLVASFLAEIYRRCGDPALALELLLQEIGTDPVESTRQIGTPPGLEYIEALLELGRAEEAFIQSLRLRDLWPCDPFVEELVAISAENR